MDDFTQILFSENGQEYRVAMPNLVHAHPLAFNMRWAVHKYLKTIAAPRVINYIVDVGAGIGSFTIPFSIMFPHSEVLCIEPSKYNFSFLEFNTRNLLQVRAIKVAAHDKKEILRIAAPTIVQRSEADCESDTGMISVYGEGVKYAETVMGEKLDDLVKRPVDWLKIDVEGHELHVLKGAERILTQDKPILQIEFREENQKMARTSSARLLLEIFGYNYTMVGSIRGDLLFRPGEIL